MSNTKYAALKITCFVGMSISGKGRMVLNEQPGTVIQIYQLKCGNI